ncbi:MAG: single-stranded DNA-binding protein [Chloroflexi bacterium]|nr:single-stranded DNA-binding protein [Chloroflexota bacterium]
MPSSLNKVMIIGNLGRDPEMRYLPNGRPVTSFSVAVNYRRNAPDGQPREETEWFNVVMYERLAETAHNYLHKGQQVYIEGRLQTRSWQDQEGQRHQRTEVIASQMIMLGSRGSTTPGDTPGEGLEPEADLASDGDLPF